MIDEYIRKARCVRVVDGDTIVVDIDLGFFLTMRDHVRLLGIDCPEIRGPARMQGEAAKLFVMDWFGRHGNDITLRTVRDKSDSFGRYLAHVVAADGSSLSADLLNSGHAVPFMEGSK